MMESKGYGDKEQSDEKEFTQPKQTSAKKIEANRLNGRKSNGPKDTDKTRLNALKHGLFSNEAVIKTEEMEESLEEYDTLRARVLVETQPQGFLEEIQAELMLDSIWGLKRLRLFQNGKVREQLVGLAEREATRRRSDAMADYSDSEAPYAGDSLRATSSGIKQLRDMLGYIRIYLSRDGYIPENAMVILKRYFDFGPKGFAFRCELASKLAREEQMRSLPPGKEVGETRLPEKYAEEIEELIEGEDRELEMLAVRLEVIEGQELDAKKASLILPPPGTVDLINRVETRELRKLYKAMDSLKQLKEQDSIKIESDDASLKPAD